MGGTIYSAKSLICWLCQLFSNDCLAAGKHFFVAYLLILKLITAKLTFVLCVLVLSVNVY